MKPYESGFNHTAMNRNSVKETENSMMNDTDQKNVDFSMANKSLDASPIVQGYFKHNHGSIVTTLQGMNVDQSIIKPQDMNEIKKPESQLSRKSDGVVTQTYTQ